MADQIFDVLEQLLEWKWRDVSAPTSEFDTEIDQDLVQHKWPNRDGAHVEATGRAPLMFTATLHFRNFIIPGLSETWNAGGAVLYPTVFRNFFQAMATRSSGPLQHPEFGLIQCKPKSAKCKWLASRRDGCDVTAAWIESLDDTVSDFKDILARKSPEPLAFVASADIDEQVIEWDNPPVTDDGLPTTFSDDVQSILNAYDIATIVSAQYGAKIDSVLYRVQSLEDRVSAANDVTAWPLISSCERLKGALYDLKVLLLTSEQNVQTITLQADTTLAALTAITGGDISDLITLNPALASTLIVTAGTTVRYYQPLAA